MRKVNRQAAQYLKILYHKLDFVFDEIHAEYGPTKQDLLKKLKIQCLEDFKENHLIYLVQKYKVNPAYLYHEKVKTVFADF